jgi:hypothetical protein
VCIDCAMLCYARAGVGKVDELCVGEVLAYSGQYMDAAKTFARAGQVPQHSTAQHGTKQNTCSIITCCI